MGRSALQAFFSIVDAYIFLFELSEQNFLSILFFYI